MFFILWLIESSGPIIPPFFFPFEPAPSVDDADMRRAR